MKSGTVLELGRAKTKEGYEVTFNTNGGNSVSTMSTIEFDKWTLNEGAKGNLNGTVYTFGDSDDTIMANYKNVEITLPTTTKNGYTFEGWYADSGLTTKVGNANENYIPTSNITLYAKWNATSSVINSTQYRVNEEKQIVSGINPETTVSELKSGLTGETTYTIKDKNNNEIQDTDKLATGYKIVMQDGKEYKIAVSGDINGDGKISIIDVARLQKIAAGVITASDIETLAGDFNKDNKISIIDLAKIQKLATGQNIF